MRRVSLSLPSWLNMIAIGDPPPSSVPANNEETCRRGQFECVCQCMVWANCPQFKKKDGLLGWGGRALTALPFIAALSFIQTQKGCVRRGEEGPLFVFPASGKSSRRIGMCFRPHEPSRFLLPEPRPTQQRENPAEISHSSPGRGDSVKASGSFTLKYVLSLCGVFKHTQIHTSPATWSKLNRQQREAESAGSNHRLQNSVSWRCLETDSVRWSCSQLPAEPPSKPDLQLGLSSLGGVLRLDTPCHLQAKANEISAWLISVLRPLSSLVISWVNDQGPATLGWAQRGVQGGWGYAAFEHYPGASANTRRFDSLSSGLRREGGRVCAEEGVRREYNPFVSIVSVATAVMKNKNWINKTYFFLSGVAIRHRLTNLAPVCAPRNARCLQSCV